MANTFNHNDKVVITDGGSVGIGKTSSISAPLNVFNSSSTTIAVFENNANFIELKLGDSSNTNYTNMVFYSNSGNAQIWKAGSAYTNYGGASSLNIYNSNGAIAFHPNATTNAMFINTSGNVGIGTTSPSEKLEVAGNLKIQANATNAISFEDDGAFTSMYSDAVLRIYQRVEVWGGGTGKQYLNVRDASGNVVVMLNGADNSYFASNNVGIGTTSPSEKLHVENGSIRIQHSSNPSLNLYTSTTQRGNLQWQVTTNYVGVRLFNMDNSNLMFGTWGNERMRIDTNGNVGIGTISPSYKLDVAGTAYVSDDLLVGATNASSWHRVSIKTGGFIAQHGNKGVGAYADANTDSEEIFAYNYATPSYIPLKLRSSALNIQNNSGSSVIYHNGTNVGIGTTSPITKLHVYGDLAVGGDNSDAILRFIEGTNGWTIRHVAIGNRLAMSNVLGGTDHFNITETGSVGIGTTSPSDKLHVAGSVKITTGDVNLDAGRAITFYGNSNTNHSISSTNNTGGSADDIRINSYGAIYFNLDSNSNNTSGADFKIARHGGTSTLSDYLFTLSGETGNVGIGTTSPDVKLHVNGEGIFEDYITLGVNNTDGKAAIYFDESSSASRATSAMYVSYDGTNLSGDNNRLSLGSLKSGVGDIVNVTYGGNVGIGTTGPSYKLEVSGTSYFSGLAHFGQTAGSGSAFRWGAYGTAVSSDTMLCMNQLWNGSGWSIISSSLGTTSINLGGAVAAPDISFGTGGANTSATTKVIIKNNGNVGIGTTSPYYKLQVEGSTGVRNGSLFIGDESGSTNSAVEFYKSGNTLRLYTNTGAFGGTYGAGYVNIDLYSDAAYSTRISGNGASYFNAGNVGIGTTSPTSKLYIEGGSADWNQTTPGKSVGTIHFDPGVDTDNFGNAITFGASDRNNGTDAHAGIYVRSDGSYGTKMYFATTDSYALGSKTRMFINNDGNVGIGTTSPTRKLHVSSGSTYPALFDSTQDYTLGLARSGTEEWWFKAYSSGNFAIHENGVGDQLYIKAGGNVGIGTTSPAYKLEVSGGAISIKGNAPGNSLRFDDSGGTSRNAMYVDTSNYLNIGNANYAGVKFVQTATTPNTGAFDGQSVQQAVGTTDEGVVLAAPDAWLAVRVGTTDYAIPMYTTG